MESTSFDDLISRALDGGARTSEWDALERVVRCEPALAAELVRGLRLERGLESAVGEALGAADRVALPRSRARAFTRHSGWLAAAAIALGWGASTAFGPAGAAPERAEPDASIASVAGAPGVDQVGGDALASSAPTEDAPRPGNLRRLQPGESSPAGGGAMTPVAFDPRFESLGELPLQMLRSRALETGGYEVLFVRPMLQRTVVDGALELANDELGEPHLIPASLARDEEVRDL